MSEEKTVKIRTMINGKEADWTPYILDLWKSLVEWRIKATQETITDANYYEPRPYVDQYNRGTNTEGFVYTINGRHVCWAERIYMKGRN